MDIGHRIAPDIITDVQATNLNLLTFRVKCRAHETFRIDDRKDIDDDDDDDDDDLDLLMRFSCYFSFRNFS